ncbi:MAG: LysR family substrate-binding domain-containing protein, partial [Beijerinckiaceae bacterium]
RLRDLADEPFVLGEPRFWAHFHAHLHRLCETAGFSPRAVQYASNNEGILGLVACGMGVSVQAESIRIYGRSDVVIRMIDDEKAEVPTVAAWRSDALDPVTARLVSHVKTLYGEPVRARPGVVSG